MLISRVDISDKDIEDSIYQILKSNGFAPRRSGDLLLLTGVGSKHGDKSVNLELNLVDMDGHRILEFKSTIATKPLTFDQAVLIAAHGNQQSLVAKFSPIEYLMDEMHQISAHFVMNADYLEEKVLSSMLYLFIKELDRIDNKLIEMSRGFQQ